MSGMTYGAPLPDDETEQAASARRIADAGALDPIHPAGQEAVDLALGVDDAEGCIARLGKVADPVDDELEDGLQVQHGRDGAGRRVQGSHPLGSAPGLGAGPHGVEDELDGAPGLIAAIERRSLAPGVQDQAPERDAALVGDERHASQRRRHHLGTTCQRPDSEPQTWQRRSIHVKVGAHQAVGVGQARERPADVCPPRRGGSPCPGVQRVKPLVERQPAVGHRASVAGRPVRRTAPRIRAGGHPADGPADR